MYILYKSDNLQGVLVQIVKKSRANDYKISILCKNEEITNNLSIMLWHHCIPNWIKNDLYESQNNIFLSTDIKYVDVLIVFDDALFNEDEEEFQNNSFIKKIVLGTNHHLKGTYWGKQKNGWKELSEEVFFS